MSQQNQVIFNGRYELHRRLGRGGMAEVYLARDQLLDRPVAVKVLFPALATDAGFVERFRREAQAAANLQHPNIVSVFDWGEANGTYFIVMEYVEGHTLADTIRDEGRLHPDRAAEITADIAAALGFAHRNRVVHRDVKPGNVLLTRDGGVKVADFGIARALSDSAEAIAYKHVQENPVPPRRLDPSLPETLEAITLKCLAKNPANRYPSAQDLRADLRRYLDGSRILAEPVLAPPVDPGATGMMAPTGYGDQTALVAGPVGYQSDGYDDYDEYDDYQDEEEPKRSKWFLAALVLLLVVLAGLLFLLVNSMSDTEDPVEMETVPTVLGQDVAAAEAAITAAGFQVEKVVEPNDAPAGQVFAQDPQGADEAEVGSTVTLSVSGGPETSPVPDVVNMTALEANQTLTAAGFLVTQVAVEDDEVEEDHVVSQDPPANAEAAPGATITINVSSGSGTVTVPGVAGQSEGDARSTLNGAGLSNVTSQQQASSDVPEGTVIGTNPAEGQEVAPDQTITLLVSSGPDQVQVPGVERLSEQNARTLIEGAGLVMAPSDETVSNAGQDGQVLRQSPGPGQEANPGDTVNVVIARFREPEDPPDTGTD